LALASTLANPRLHEAATTLSASVGQRSAILEAKKDSALLTILAKFEN